LRADSFDATVKYEVNLFFRGEGQGQDLQPSESILGFWESSASNAL